jgi:hypothetical protein
MSFLLTVIVGLIIWALVGFMAFVLWGDGVSEDVWFSVIVNRSLLMIILCGPLVWIIIYRLGVGSWKRKNGKVN